MVKPSTARRPKRTVQQRAERGAEAQEIAMADVLLRAGERHPLGMATEVLRDWKSLSHAKLFELVGPATHDGDVKAYLSRPAILGRQYGRCF